MNRISATILSPMSQKSYDIAIIGAGPAGTSTALALADSGLRLVVLDKSDFPRDKICGDAIPARCEHVLRKIKPEFAWQLQRFANKIIRNQTRAEYSFKVFNLCRNHSVRQIYSKLSSCFIGKNIYAREKF